VESGKSLLLPNLHADSTLIPHVFLSPSGARGTPDVGPRAAGAGRGTRVIRMGPAGDVCRVRWGPADNVQTVERSARPDITGGRHRRLRGWYALPHRAPHHNGQRASHPPAPPPDQPTDQRQTPSRSNQTNLFPANVARFRAAGDWLQIGLVCADWNARLST
jgi:hypothetical protein